MAKFGFANRCVNARRVVEIFFPQRPDLGLDQTEYSPTVIDKIVSANAEQKSAYQAKKTLWKQAEISVSVPVIHQLTAMIGEKLQEHLQRQAVMGRL